MNLNQSFSSHIFNCLNNDEEVVVIYVDLDKVDHAGFLYLDFDKVDHAVLLYLAFYKVENAVLLIVVKKLRSLT